MSQATLQAGGLLILLLAAAAVVSALAGLLALRLVGAAVESVSIGFGPTLLRLRTGGAALEIRLFPVGCAVQPRRLAAEIPPLRWSDALLGHLAAPVALLMLAAALGAGDALGAAWRAWSGIVRFGAPWGGMASAWAGLLDDLGSAPLAEAAALVFAGVAAVDLTPLPPMPGGMAVHALLRGLAGEAAAETALGWVATPGVLVVLAAALVWGAGLVLFLAG